MTIMTFNIKGSYYEDGENNWPFRAQLNVDTIRKANPDLIGFQEFQQGNLETYNERLPEYAYELGPLVARENDSGSGYHCAIYWRADRFEKQDQGYFFLNETPWVYALHWGVTQGRGVNWVRLQDKQTGCEFIHLNTHLAHDSEEARRKGAQLIVDRMPALVAGSLPMIATADYNTRAVPLREEWVQNWEAQAPDEYRGLMSREERPYLWENVVYQTFTQAGFQDSAQGFIAEDDINQNTFHGMRGSAFPQVGARIDWILLRDGSQGFTVHDTVIMRDEAPPLYPSDHYPVYAIVDLC